MSQKSAVEALIDLGLTEYEARVYTALARIKTGIASEIHQMSGIPRSAVYGALEKLEKRGIVEIQRSKPMRYKVVSPAATLERLRTTFLLEARTAMDAIEEVYSTEEVEEEEESTWTYRGARNVHYKALELTQGAKSELFISSYALILGLEERYPIFKDVTTAMSNALYRGVRLRIVSSDEGESQMIRDTFPGAVVVVHPSRGLRGSLMIADQKKALLVTHSGNGKVNALGTDGRNTVSTFGDFAEALWLLESRPNKSL